MLTIVEDASPTASVAEQLVMARSWSRVLEPIIPVLRLPEVWEFAFQVHTTSFDINHYDLKNAWAAIIEMEREREEKRDKSPIERCTGKKYHVLKNGVDIGETKAQNPFTGNDELLPCPLCRPDDEVKWKADQRARFGEIKVKQYSPSDAVEKILRPAEIYLDSGLAAELCAEFNALVEKLMTGSPDLSLYLVKFDAGANVFKYPHRADILFTEKDLRRKIESYRKALEAREAQ